MQSAPPACLTTLVVAQVIATAGVGATGATTEMVVEVAEVLLPLIHPYHVLAVALCLVVAVVAWI